MTRIMHQHAQLTYLVDVLAVDFEIVEHSSAEQKKVSGLFFGLLWSVSSVVVEL